MSTQACSSTLSLTRAQEVTGDLEFCRHSMLLLTPCLHVTGAAASISDPSTPLGKAVRILNNQLQALTSVDEQTSTLEARLEKMLSAPGYQSNSNMYA